jgi:hypothetical protein
MHHNLAPDWGATPRGRMLPKDSPGVPLLPSRGRNEAAIIGNRYELIVEPRLTQLLGGHRLTPTVSSGLCCIGHHGHRCPGSRRGYRCHPRGSRCWMVRHDPRNICARMPTTCQQQCPRE